MGADTFIFGRWWWPSISNPFRIHFKYFRFAFWGGLGYTYLVWTFSFTQQPPSPNCNQQTGSQQQGEFHKKTLNKLCRSFEFGNWEAGLLLSPTYCHHSQIWFGGGGIFVRLLSNSSQAIINKTVRLAKPCICIFETQWFQFQMNLFQYLN